MQRGFRVEVAAALAVLLAINAATSAAETKKIALLVGIDDYQHDGFENLKCAENDVNTLGTELGQLGFKTVVLTGSGKGDLQATRQNIEQGLASQLKGVSKEDIVVIVLAGHGMHLKAENAKSRPDAFFCPVDAVFGETKTMLSLNHLLDDVLKKRGGRNIVLVDARRNSSEDSAHGVYGGIEGRLVTIPKDTAVFFSCRAGQKSFEDVDGLGHGVFSYAVLKALRETSSHDGDVRWYDVVSHVTKNFKSPEILRAIPAQRMQEPVLAGEVGDFVIAGTKTLEPVVPLEHSKPLSNVSGFWKGTYSYKPSARRKSVPFVILLVQQGEIFTGFLREPNTFGASGFPYLYASIDGKVEADGSLSFKKTYDGTARVNHDVFYKGTLTTDLKKVTDGTWDIPRQWGGTFTFEKFDLGNTNAQSGVWNGTYYYKEGATNRPVDFQLFAIQSGNEFLGFIKEPNTFGKVDTPWLYADVSGQIDSKSRRLSFKKTYDGTGGETHDVKYSGTLGDAGDHVTDGRWEIRRDWTGTFSVQRFFP